MLNVFSRPILTVRIHSGLNAESFLAGLLSVAGPAELFNLEDLLKSAFPRSKAHALLYPLSVNHIAGFSCRLDCPHEHVHRTPADIEAIYENESALTPAAREITRRIWSVVAHAEARVHDACVEDVHFHEVGRMSNILAIGLIAEVFAAVNPIDFVCSPVPLGDGEVVCAHGVVTNPAPALLSMIDGVAVKPFAGEGEAVTPTGLAILLGLGARFDCWPQMRVRRHATAFHNKKVFNGCANGLLFALGDALQS